MDPIENIWLHTYIQLGWSTTQLSKKKKRHLKDGWNLFVAASDIISQSNIISQGESSLWDY